MIQPIYTSVTNANVTPCGKKGTPISCEPIPLLKNNYLGEYRTELEKAKVRKNLGIADEASLLWGNIAGTIEDLSDLILYVEGKQSYTPPKAGESTPTIANIDTVKEALDYALYFIGQYEDNTEDIAKLKLDIIGIRNSITALRTDLNTNTLSITDLQLSIANINTRINDLNSKIETINVDENILNWITKSLENSETIKIKEDKTLEVILSELETNAVKVDSGIYVEDLKPLLTETKSQVESNTTNINSILSDLETIDTYQTTLPDDTLSTVITGTTVELLKDKSFSEIIDTLIFPTYVRDLILPELYYSSIPELIEVGSSLLHPTLIFIKNDAGEETSRTETVTYNSIPVTSYNSIGVYTHSATVTYNAGDYLINNKGEITDKKIEAGSISTTSSIIATYPWYSGNESGLVKLKLVPFNQSSGVIDFSLSGKAIIKLPGSNTQLNSFTVDGGLGYLNVDLTGWVTSTEEINGFSYKVWTKIDSYSSVLPHRINFTLSE